MVHKFVACILILALTALSLLWVQGALAVTPEEADSQAHQIWGSVMSPFCAGRLLQDCPSSGAEELRVKIKEMLLEGSSNQQVMQFLYENYGDQIRSTPKQEGFGLLAWISPFIFLALGAVLIFFWIRSNLGAAKENAAASALDPEMQRKIAEELERS